MKRQVLFFILFLPALLSYVGCSNNGSVENMSNEEILKVLDVKIHKHPKDDKLLYDRAKIYMQMNRINEAIADLTRAVSLNGKEYDYHMLLGDAYFANGDVEHSYKSLQDALNLKPNSQEAYLKLGEIAYYSRDYDRAMDNLSKVTAKDPQNRTALFMKMNQPSRNWVCCMQTATTPWLSNTSTPPSVLNPKIQMRSTVLPCSIRT